MPSLAPYSGNLSRRQAVHLLHRATVGYSQAEIDAIEGMSAPAAVDHVFAQTAAEPLPPTDPLTGASFNGRAELSNGSNPAFNRTYVRNWFLKEMMETAAPAREKMTLFLHTHFTNDQTKTAYGFPLYHQNALFRKYALGNFKTLAKKVCRDYAMSVFLDGWTNTSQEPNENFAREFLELFTIGKGPQIGAGNYTTYTEDDVREAARVLTGFLPVGFLPDGSIPGAPPVETDPGTGLLQSSIWNILHDFMPKQFSAAFGNATINGGFAVADIENELDAFIEMIFGQQATARHICTKLYRFFCYYELTPDVESDIVDGLAATFQASNYELLPVLKQLMKSEHFFDQDDAVAENNNAGAIIKSPAELLAGAFRYFGIDIGGGADLLTHNLVLATLDNALQTMDMTLFEPPEVAGYPAYHQTPHYNRNWLSAASLVNRYAGFELLTFGVDIPNTSFTLRLDTVGFVQNSGNFANPGDPNDLVDTLAGDLFPFGVEASKRTALKNMLTDGDPDYYWTNAWNAYTSGGNELTVRVRLNNLFNAILQSAEFQLS